MSAKKMNAHLQRMNSPQLKVVPNGSAFSKPGFEQAGNSKISSREIRKIGHKLNAIVPKYRKAG